MAKNVIKFKAVPYSIGTGSAAKTGFRVMLSGTQPILDLAFVQEVVTAKRLAMSAEELLHGVQMLVEVGMAKVAEDGRARGITGLLKFQPVANGRVENLTSAWDPTTCTAFVRALLMTPAEEKIIDADFQNEETGIGVKLDNVTWVGAQTVTNVIKTGVPFAAYGRNMQFLTGDTAQLEQGGTYYTLTCTSSDVSHAVFEFPATFTPEAGSTCNFIMKSRGGVEEGEVYTSIKKGITCISA